MVKQNFLALLFYAVALAVAPAGAAENAAPNSDAAVAPVFKPGERWTFHAEEKLPLGSYKSNLLNGDYELAIGLGGRMRAFLVAQERRVLVAQPRNLHHMLPTAQAIRQSRQYFNFPLAVGKSWTAKGNSKSAAEAEIKIAGRETVTTTAGSFRAWRLERRVSKSKKYTKQDFTEIYYYSAETRSVVKYHYQRDRYESIGTPAVTTVDVELIRLPSSKAPRNAKPTEPQLELPREENRPSP
jgi:hypothetical protein